MVSGVIIGVIVVVAIALIIIITYICKCYADLAFSRHKENIKPIDLNENGLALISVDIKNPLAYDPYFDGNELVDEDHNDLDMVHKSVDQFIRRDSYRKSKGKLKYSLKSDEMIKTIASYSAKNHENFSKAETTFETFENKDDPTIMHNSDKADSILPSNNQFSNPIEMSQIHSNYEQDSSEYQTSGYSNQDIIPILSPEKQLATDSLYSSEEHEKNPIVEEDPPLEQFQCEEVQLRNGGMFKTSMDSEPTAESLFYIPDEAFSPRSEKRQMYKNSKIAVNTLDDFTQNENFEALKKSRKSPRGQRKRKKSVVDLTGDRQENKDDFGNQDSQFRDYNYSQITPEVSFPPSITQNEPISHGRTSQL